MSLWVGQYANGFPGISQYFLDLETSGWWWHSRELRDIFTWWVSVLPWPPEKKSQAKHFSAPSPSSEGSGFKMKNFPLPILKVHEILHSWGGDKFTLFIQSCKNPRRWLRGSAMIYLMEVTKVKVCKAAGGQRRHNVRRINLVSRSALWTQNFVFSILNLCKGPKSMMMKMIKWFTPPSKYTACTWYFDHCSSGNWP